MITTIKTTATALSLLPSYWVFCFKVLLLPNVIITVVIQVFKLDMAMCTYKNPACGLHCFPLDSQVAFPLPSSLISPYPVMETRCHTFKNPFPCILLDSTPLEGNLKSASLGKSFPINRDLLCHLHHSLPPNQA